MYKQVTINTPTTYLSVLLTLALARIIRRVYIKGQSYGEVMSDVPYMSGFLFPFGVFVLLCFEYRNVILVRKHFRRHP
jgi:hypothetical protein